VLITGPTDASHESTWTVPFGQNVTKSEISQLTQHYYRADGQLSTSTAAYLITPDSTLVADLATLKAGADGIGVPYRMSECNSFYNGLPFTLDKQTLAQGMNFTFQTDFGDIDLLGELSGVGQFPDLARDAVLVELYGIQILVASLDSLIRSKRAAGRPKDLNVLPELEALKALQAPFQTKEQEKR
jgi:hypothetical protein